jgi:transcriptional regulator with XRE-family HTH domain
MSLGKRIASMRGFRTMTQEQLGGMVGVTKQTISGWETDRRVPDADDLRALCKVLNCTSDYLLEFTNDPNGHVRW